MTDIIIQPEDLEDARFVLRANLTWLQARDLQDAQLNLNATRPSALTQETGRVLQKLDYLFSQYLIEEHEASLYKDDPGVEEDVAGDPEASEGLTEGDLEPLSDAPLGSFEVPAQEGRRLTYAEMFPDDVDAEGEEDAH